MKRNGLLHPQFAGLIGLGHGQLLTIADAGLPICPHPQRINLAVRCGVPPFIGVLWAVAAELVVEQVVVIGLRRRSAAEGAGRPRAPQGACRRFGRGDPHRGAHLLYERRAGGGGQLLAMAVLELRHISKRYEGVPALSDVDFGAATELGAVNGIRGTTAVPP